VTTADARQESHSSGSSGDGRISQSTLTSWAAYAIFVVAGFFMPRLIDRHLGQAALGIWDFGWSVVAYLSLTQLGVGSAVNRYVARYRAQGEIGSLARTTSSAFGIQLAAATASIGLTVTLVLLIQSRAGSPGGPPGSQVRWVILLLGLNAAVQMAFDVFRGVITGCQRWDLHNGLNAGSYILTVAAMASALAFGGELASLALATLAVTILTEATRAAVAYSICPDLSVDLRRLDRGTVHQLLRFGLKSFLVDASGLILYQSANILIATNLGVAALAVFARPMALVRHATVIMNKYAYVLAPTASSLQAVGRSDGVSALVVRTTQVAVYLALPMMLGLAILGDSIVELWMGAAYRGSPIIFVLAAGHLLPMVQEPLVSILTGTNAHGKAGLALAAAAGLGVLLGVVAVGHEHWGLVGAALSITIPLTLIKGLYLPFAACRHLGLSFGPYLVAALLRPALHLSPLALVIFACRLALPAQPLRALAWGLGLGSLVLLPVYWYGLLTPEFRASIRTRLGFTADPIASHQRAFGKALFRRIILAVCRAIGLLHLWRYLHRQEVVILTIHGVMDATTPVTWAPLRPQLPPSTLDRSLTMLHRHYRFVSLQAAVEMLAGRTPIQPYSLAVTFDDGYRNNLTHALPILRRHGVPATLFLSTGHVEHRRPFWFDRLDYAIQQAPYGDRTLVVAETPIRFTGSERPSLRVAYRRLRATAKASPRDDADTVRELEVLAERLEDESGRRLLDIFEQDPWSAVATWGDLKAVAGTDFELGSHTVDHVRLHLVDAETIREQLTQSKCIIESQVHRPCRYLCYPNGGFDARTIALAQDSGYEAALTNIEGNNRRGADLFTLRRRVFPITANATELLADLSGFSALLARIRATLRHLPAASSPLPSAPAPWRPTKP
jgi:O-antigen/teichoic acid export membrane protein/peptidoglycan/xylan/chitin deacetylase (PgdA/CDA1 family)